MSIGPNPLNDISKVYLEAVAAKPDFLDLDKDGNKKEPMKKAAKEVEAPKERLKTDRDMFNIPKGEQQSAKERLLAKARAKRAKMNEETVDEAVKGADPEMRKAASAERRAGDKPLSKKEGDKHAANMARKIKMSDKVSKAKNHMPGYTYGEETVIEKKGDGNLANNYPPYDKVTRGDIIAGALGKDQKGGKKKVKESFSNWRQDLSEVITDTEENKQIKEKKVNNTIKINPKLGEAVEEIGGTLIEMVEIDEFDFVIESVYCELIEEGYTEDEVEDAIETALTEELQEGYYDTAVATSKAKSQPAQPVKRTLKDRLKSAAKKVITRGAYAAGKAVKGGVAAAAAPGRAKRKVKSISDKVKSVAKAGYAAGRGPVEKKTTYRGAGVGRKEKIGEQTVVKPIGIDASKTPQGTPEKLLQKMTPKYGGGTVVRTDLQKAHFEPEGQMVDEVNAGPSTPVKAYDTPKGKQIMPQMGAGRPTNVRLKPGVVKTAEEVEIDENVATGKARRAKFGGISQKVGKSEVVTNKEKSAALEKHAAAKQAKQKAAGEAAHKAASAKGLSPAEAEMRRKAAERKAARMRKEEVEQLDEMPYQVIGSPDGKKEKKIGKPVKSKKYADARASELSDTHKKTGGKYRSEYTEEFVDEKLNLKKEKMGDVIKDFYKSDAPQFKGRSKEKRRQMAIAAKLTAERGGKKLGEQQQQQDPNQRKMIGNMTQLQMKKQQLDRRKLQMKKRGEIPLNTEETKN